MGIITLVALSAIYTIVRLYFLHKKWWLLIILMVVALASTGFFLLRAPAITLSINGQKVTSTSVSFSTGSVSVTPAPQSIGEYTRNTQVTITATPASGYRFDHWEGDASGNVTSVTITMDASKGVTESHHPLQSNQINVSGGTD
ncbi:MAG: hypothetical protein HYU83_05090 [Chloroflexi bacterium]|nr:hypothetical protein [Chloroflexota bacterium]